MSDYKHIWGQGIINFAHKDLGTLKLKTCIENIIRYFPTQKGKILEIGCGAGRFIRSLKTFLSQYEYYGCDIDVDAINLAKSYNDSIDYQVADAASLPYGQNVFDIVVLIDILEHIGDTEHFIAEILKVTRKGSILHIYVPCEGEPYTLYWLLNKIHIGNNLTRKHAGHMKKFTKQDVSRIFETHGFKILNKTYSTYLTGQILDLIFYSLQEIHYIKVKLLKAHANKDKTDGRGSWRTRIIKKVINAAFYIGYLESITFKRGFLAQGLHLTCMKK